MILPPSTRAFYQGASADLSGLRAHATRLQTQIATGERLTRSSDDPLAAARLRDLARHDTLGAVHKDNAARAMADLSRADDALGAMADHVIRAKELALLAANGTASDSDRAMIATEIAALRESLLALANTQDSTGRALFGGAADGPAYVLGGDGAAIYAGLGANRPLALGAGQTVDSQIMGPQFLNFSAAGNPTDLFAVLASLATTQEAGGPGATQAAQGALEALDKGLQSLTTTQTIVGARMGWIDVVAERHMAEGELSAQQKADLGGADIADTMMRLQQTMTALEASQASFVRLAGLSLFSMLR